MQQAHVLVDPYPPGMVTLLETARASLEWPSHAFWHAMINMHQAQDTTQIRELAGRRVWCLFSIEEAS